MNNPENILTTFRKDKSKGIRLLYDAYYEILLLYANGITGDTGAAEDAVQECFISFWTRDHLVKLHEGLEGYLFRSVKYAALNQVRATRRRQHLHDLASKEKSRHAAAADDNEPANLDGLFAAINRLPEERRKIFLMICVDGLSYKETAGALSISINTVKTQMARAVKSLREELRGRLLQVLLSWIAGGKHRGTA
ncbi:MAG: sigma-70 family RNA polymerase sigma factor [Odoribacteraceae bacterium]|nr:sigma-70 family RNA polymerase sigma factor [Odoribacteraceae bacterium]